MSYAKFPQLVLSSSSGLLAMFDLQMFLLKVLAVAGGGAIGFFLTGWALKVIGRLLLRKKGEPPAFNMVRSLGMVALGLLVYFWAFGAGGGGFGGAGGWWPFGGAGGTGSDPALSGHAPDDSVTEQVAKAVQKEKADLDHALQVRLLGGEEVVDQRFYLVDQGKQAVTWEALVSLLKKKQQEDPRFRVLEIVLYQGSVDRGNPAVTKLENWARDNHLNPKFIIHGVDLGRERDPTERRQMNPKR
jgi:hypothetical protein